MNKRNMGKITSNDIKVAPKKVNPIDDAKERQASIRKMIEGRDEKIINARKHLVDSLETTSKKYLTANGIMNALGIIREVIGNSDDIPLSRQLDTAKRCARHMSDKALKMMEKIEGAELENIDKVVDEFYSHDYTDRLIDMDTFTVELMSLSLCQNVGPNAQDILDFANSSDEEIKKAQDDLEEFCKENEIDMSTLSEA